MSDAATAQAALEPLEPRQSRTEADRDRIVAAAWFGQGRLLHQRERKAEALRAYQRAWRYDPTATTILSDIVALAYELDRKDEAARYAVLAAESNPKDAILVRRLALYLADERQWTRAVRLYERSLELQPEMKEVTDLGSAVLHQEMGRLYFLSEEYGKSAASFAKLRNALATEPSVLGDQDQAIILGGTPAETYSLWAESFLAAERYDDAAALFEQANKKQANPGVLALQRARVEAARGATADALKHLEEHFAADNKTETLEPYVLLSTLLEKKHPERAQAQAALLAKLEALSEKRSNDAALTYFLSDRLIEAGRVEDAEKLLTATLAKQPAGDGFRQLVSLYRKQSKTAPLAEALSQTVKQTGSLQSIDSEAAALASDSKLLDSLIQYSREQLARDPKPAAGRQWFSIGQLALQAKKWDAAQEMFEAQIQMEPALKSDVLLNWGLGLYLADEYGRAVTVFQRAIEEKALGDNRVAVYLSLAGAMELDGRTDDALVAAKKASAENPENVAIAARIGWILYHSKRYADAEKAYRQLIGEHDARHDSAILRETLRDARLALSSVLLAQDKFDEAVEQLEQVLDEYPDDAGALNDLGYLWAERGLHLERSLAMVQKAVLAEPENSSYRDSLGWAYHQHGRYTDAVRELELAAAGADPGGVVLEHLGDAYAKVDQSEKARLAWDRALESYQNERETEKLKALRQKVAEYKP